MTFGYFKISGYFKKCILHIIYIVYLLNLFVHFIYVRTNEKINKNGIDNKNCE